MVTFKDCIRAVSDHRMVDVVDILSPSRKQFIAYARQEVAYLARAEAAMTYSQIAACLNRDHTTVHYSVDAVINRMLSDPKYGREIDRIVDELTYKPSPQKVLMFVSTRGVDKSQGNSQDRAARWAKMI